ncbi:allantoin permease [Lactobacillus sp. LC28-10]|uniref:Allantoin permease n=1 Tax=Secundilactobacillus angelensis TaxID=2722706 RepID=A0ABX1KZY5_9LACO|nr:NCS1 family transporter [Secundilactobacillus angelensis]MCH5463035.1 NCS1 family transporter [Secundilactobacillus angelensis]NLR19501.1 allantoin permease [Secundilactobacillus angelensis]
MTPPTVAQQVNQTVAEDLLPIPAEQRKVGVFAYMAMWLGDGFNIGNITLGSSIVVAGIATMNLLQTMVAAGIAIIIISLIFTLNDRFGYRTGAPYVIQLRLSFGLKGAKIASLFRGIPAIVWFGFQSWTGALALNQIGKTLLNSNGNHTFECFLILQILQVVMALWGFRSIKLVTGFIATIVMIAMVGVFLLLVTQHQAVIQQRLVRPAGTWGLPFWGLIVAFLGNYTAIFESAADYSRELRPNLGEHQRGLLYLIPIGLAYGMTIVTGAMLAAVTGIASPVTAMAHLLNNGWMAVMISFFIVLGTITTNMVANIMPPTYMLTSLLKMPQQLATTIVGVLAVATCPWILVQDSSAQGLTIFIHLYSIFLGPMTAIILIEYYLHRHQQVNVTALYNDGQQPSFTWRAPLALLIGAVAAASIVNLSWFVGFFVGGLVYWKLRTGQSVKIRA